MANTQSAKKDAKRSAIRAQRNRSIRSSVKTKITKFRRGVTERVEGAEELVTVAISALDRAVSKGVLHRNNAARRKARLMKRLAAAGQTPAPATTSAKGSRASTSKTTSRSKAASKR